MLHAMLISQLTKHMHRNTNFTDAAPARRISCCPGTSRDGEPEVAAPAAAVGAALAAAASPVATAASAAQAGEPPPSAHASADSPHSTATLIHQTPSRYC